MVRFEESFWASSEKVMSDEWQDAAVTRGVWGMAAGMRVATGYGWRPVEAVAVGDMVLTFDHGMQRVTGVTRQVMWSGAVGNPADWPLLVPEGVLGNHDPMTILPGQAVIIESDLAEKMFGEPFVTIPAAALAGFRGIQRHLAARHIDVVLLSFAEEQVIFANCGALFLCPERQDLLNARRPSGAYEPVSIEVARVMLEGMQG